MNGNVQDGVVADELTAKSWVEAITAPPIDVNDALDAARVAAAAGWHKMVAATAGANPIREGV